MALPFIHLSAQPLHDALSPQRLAEPLSLESQKYLPAKKTEGQESNRAGLLKCITLREGKKNKKNRVATKGQGLKVSAILDYADSIREEHSSVMGRNIHRVRIALALVPRARLRIAGGAQSYVYSSLADANTFLDRHLAEI